MQPAVRSEELEVFGRYAGHTAFRGGVAADADCVLIPEITVDFDAVYDHVKHYYMRRILNSDVHSGTYVMVVAEGVKGEDGKVWVTVFSLPPRLAAMIPYLAMAARSHVIPHSRSRISAVKYQ